MHNQTLASLPCNIDKKGIRKQLTLTIAFHPDTSYIGKQHHVDGESVELSRLSPMFSDKQFIDNQLPLADPFISRSPILLRKAKNDWVLEKGMSPTNLCSVSHIDIDTLTIGQSQLERGFALILANRIVLMLHYSKQIKQIVDDSLGLVGVSDSLREIRNLITKVAPLKIPVLIRGESGTGKELVAQAVHHFSERQKRKLISVNMGAISKELVNAELFGSVKGAFTGAVTRNGCFVQAHKSTLFLDEIGEAPLEVQVALLRALETGAIQPVGSEQELALDVRIVASTDADLEGLIGQKSFRMPLLQRLSGLVINVLPLRDRKEDICCILYRFLHQTLQETEQLRKLTDCAQENVHYWAWFFAQASELDWPGNVRQLKNVVTQLSVALIGLENISHFDWQGFVSIVVGQSEVAQARQSDSLEHPNSVQDKAKPRDISEEEVFTALKRHNWQIKLAAEELNISRTSLYQKIDASDKMNRASTISLSDLRSCYDACSGNVDQMVKQLKVSKQALKRRLHEIGLSI